MDEDSTDNTSNIMTNFKSLAKSISSAQSNIFRCKSTLKCIEEELIYFNVNNNTNTNNRESKKLPSMADSPDQGQTPYEMIEIEAEPTKTIESFSRYSFPESGFKSIKNRKSFSKLMVIPNSDTHNTREAPRNTNVSNISGELNNLMKAQMKLTTQIEQLKCEIGDKACAIEVCVKDNQFFNCKFKEVEYDIDQLKRDVDKIRRDLAVSCNKDRGFSPYSQESRIKDVMDAPRQTVTRQKGIEHHYGYQDVCTPENSFIAGSPPIKASTNLLINFRDPHGQSKTFEDLMRKSKLDIDCNINNCRNNQNAFSLMHPIPANPVLQDFASLTNQIRNLRKMAEAIFKGNCASHHKRTNNHPTEHNVSKNNDISQDDHSKSSNSRPIAETTLSMLNQSQAKLSAVKPALFAKRDSSSERTSVSGSDTSGCLLTEDQFPAHSPSKINKHHISKSKLQEHVHGKDPQHNFTRNKQLEDKKHLNSMKPSNVDSVRKEHGKCKETQRNGKKTEYCRNSNCTYSQFLRSNDSCKCQSKNQYRLNRPICPECNQYVTIVSN